LANIALAGVAILPALAIMTILFIGFFNLTILIEGGTRQKATERKIFVAKPETSGSFG